MMGGHNSAILPGWTAKAAASKRQNSKNQNQSLSLLILRIKTEPWFWLDVKEQLHGCTCSYISERGQYCSNLQHIACA
jgi:hypothetical protein